jgi:hypothetical protein
VAIQSETDKSGPYAANDSVVEFAGTFRLAAEDEVEVLLTDASGVETSLVLDDDYSVTPTGGSYPADSFTITTVATYATGEFITMIRDTPFTQPTTYANGGPYTASINEASYDRGVYQTQQLKEVTDRCLQIAASDTTTSVDATEYINSIEASEAAAAASAAAAAQSAIDAADYEYPSEELLSNYADITAALAAIGSTPTNLVIDQVETLTGNVSIPATITLRWVKGVVWDIGTHTLTINGAVLPANHQFFSVTSGAVAGLRFSRPQWFGATADGVTNDSTPITQAFAATPTGAVNFSSGVYRLSSNITIPDNTVVTMEGSASFSRDGGVTITNEGLLVGFVNTDTILTGAAQTTRGFTVAQSPGTTAMAATEPNELNFNSFIIDNDEVDVEGGASSFKANGLNVSHTWGGSGCTGGRHALYGKAIQLTTTSASSTDRNYVAVQGLAIAAANDNGTGGTKAGALFGSSFLADLQSPATHYANVTACELNTNVGSTTTPGYRSILQMASRDNDQGTVVDTMLALSDISSTAPGAWLNGIQIGAMNGQHPISTFGSIISTTGSASVLNGIDFDSYTFTGQLRQAPDLRLRNDLLIMAGVDAGLELGDSGSANSPFIDFHSSNNANDYDARIVATGGGVGDGLGDVQVDALNLVSNQTRPSVNNTYSIGNGTFRWTEVFATNGTINTSDERLKEQITPLDEDQSVELISALRPVSYKWKGFTSEPVTTTAVELVPVLDADGSEVWENIPIFGENGEPVYEEVLAHNEQGAVAGFKSVVSTERLLRVTSKTVEKVLHPAVDHSFKRRHYGLIAQDVEGTLGELGISTDDFAGFIRDEESGDLGLRYTEFIAPLITAVQALQKEVDILKNA